MDHAIERETLYDWLGAAETYEKVLGLVPRDDSGIVGDMLERKAYALHKAAFQSDSNDQFRDRMSMSIEFYRKAAESYVKAGIQESEGKKLRCVGMVKYLGFWHAPKLEEKKKLVNEAWGTATEALDFLRSTGDVTGFCRTYNQLSPSAFRVIDYGHDHVARAAIIKNAIAYGQHALDHIADLTDPSSRALVYLRASSFLVLYAAEYVGVNESLKCDLASRDLWNKAMAISDEVTLKETVSFSYMPSSADADEITRIGERALEFGKKANDKLVIGSAYDWIAQRSYWSLAKAVDSDELESIAARGYDLCLRAQKEYAIMGYLPAIFTWAWSPFPDPWHYAHLSTYVTDLERKRELAEKTLAIEPKLKEVVTASGYPDVARDGDVMITIALTSLAKTEQDPEKKKRLLENALRKGAAQAEEEEQLRPFFYGSHAFNANVVADIEFELANMETNLKLRSQKLKKALQRRGRSIELIEKLFEEMSAEKERPFVFMGNMLSAHATCARALYEMTGEREDLETAIHSSEAATESYSKAGLPSRCAESYWHAARSYDLLGEHQKACQRFQQAAKEYKTASEELPQLAALYQDHSNYMEAWGEMELAKHQHLKQEYVLAGEHYEKAANLLASTERWKFLATNYFAWSSLEKAEGLSKAENSKEAIRAFGGAQRSFEESRKVVQARLSKSTDAEETVMTASMVKAADVRRDYCGARAVIEEARLLDKQGRESASFEKYGQAVSMLERTVSMLENDRDKREIGLSIALARAWQMLTSAEAEVSPELFGRASQLFEKVKDLSQNEKAKSLALGHSRFCKALEAGTRFADTRDPALHTSAIKHLDSAASHYARAGAESASEYSRASKLLFDAYAAVDRAGQETDHEKKAKVYLAVEKILEASAAGFGQAEQPGKKDQVLRLLESVKRDREFAVSLTELFHAPLVVSSTASFVGPTPTYEQPVGLERFEHADIQANLLVPKRELKVDEELNIEIELVNAGRGPAQLIKLQDPVPKGFTLRREPEGYRMEDGYLNLRGKRLDPLKTEGIKLFLKPTHRGEFVLKPRILYLDESGKYKSHEPEPMMVTVGAEPTALADKALHADTHEAVEARSLLAGLNVVTLSHYRIVGNYVRYGEGVRNTLKDARQKIVAACQRSSPKRENYIIWAPPGSGKTYFVQEVAALLGDSVHYRELNLAKLDEAGFRSGLAELRVAQGPCLCLVDEVDANPDVSWPYEALMPFLDASATEGARLAFVLAGSSGSSLEEMKSTMASRPKGSDILSRVPTDNEYSIPPMGVGDRLLVVLSQFRQAGKQMGHEVREVEKLGLYYVALNPRLSNARQLREFAVRCAERVLPGDDRLKYDSLFRPGDLENKLFWTQALQSAGALVDSFLLVED